MDVYLVGGAVRDALLGRPVKDRDWVVVGATPEQMLQQGYLPVGHDFPVFLHPHTREEYALARTERKTAPGYRGFVVHAAPDVSIEQDLARRDLTINAMAVAERDLDAQGCFDLHHPPLVDPWGGLDDLRAGLLRHVTEAFREDPVRILRVARFAARYAEFALHPSTLALMQAMVRAGEAHALVAERVWQELANGLMEAHPQSMCTVLRDCGAWDAVLPELAPAAADPARWAALLAALEQARQAGADGPVRYAVLAQGGGADDAALQTQAIARLGERLRVPGEAQALALLLARERAAVAAAEGLDAEGLLALLERCDAWRRPARVRALCQAAACLVPGRSGDATIWPPARRLSAALDAALAIDLHAVTRQAQAQGLDGPRIGQAVRGVRLQAIGALSAA